ncbi:titin-like [Bolinopsis microptera]|uniref:titin-like n=1 Tax=Bolinopsis microptera TaxID=2820187 RepID=UPI0030790314
MCVFESDIDIGDYECISLRNGGNDGLDLIKVLVQIDGTVTHTIVPEGGADYIRLDTDYVDTKEFCTSGIVSPTTHTTATLTLSSVIISDTGYYWCVITYEDIKAITSDIIRVFIEGVITPPVHTVGDLGESATFTAVFTGQTTTSAPTWAKKALTTGASYDANIPRSTITQAYDSSTLSWTSKLVISTLETADEAAYACTIIYASSNQKTTTDAALSVSHAAVEPAYGFVGSSLTLTAKITANEEATNIVWFKNSAHMADTINNVYDVGTGVTTSEIVFGSAVSAGDITSTYKVTAELNIARVTVQSPEITLNQIAITENPTGGDYTVGGQGTLTCKFGPSTVSTFATPTIKWVRTTDNFEFDGTIEDTFDNSVYTSLMKIFPAAVGDAGIWKCVVTLQDFTGSIESSTATVTVSGIITSPTSDNVVQGALVTLSCVASTLTEPTVVWKEGLSSENTVTAGSGTSITNTYSGTSFTSVLIFQYTVSTTDTYVCEVTDSSTTYTSSKANFSPLVITSQPAAVIAKSGDSQAGPISCTASDHSSLTISWFKGSTELTDTNKYSFSTTSGVGEMTVINDVNIDDAGDYYCKAEYALNGNFNGGSLTSNSGTLDIISIVDEPSILTLLFNTGIFNTAYSLPPCVAIGPKEADTAIWTSDADLTATTSTKTYDPNTKKTTTTLSWASIPNDLSGSGYICTITYDANSVITFRMMEPTSKGFVTHPTSVVQSGTAVTFTAVVDGSLSSILYKTILWYGVIPGSSYYVTLNDVDGYTVTVPTAASPTSELRIDTASVTADLYTAYVAGIYVTSYTMAYSTEAYLYKREITTSLSGNTYSLPGTAYTITCTYEGDATDSLKWYKDDVELEQKAGCLVSSQTSYYQNLVQVSKLFFESPTASDSGSYKCRAITTDSTVTVDSAAFYIGIPRFIPPSTLYTTVGSTISVSCTLELDTLLQSSFSSSASYLVRDSTSISTLNLISGSTTSTTLLLAANDVLLNSASLFSPAVSYKCKGYFTGNNIPFNSTTFDIRQLQITKAPSDVNTIAGVSVTFTCSASSPTDYTADINFYLSANLNTALTSGGDYTVSSITTTNFIATKTLSRTATTDESFVCAVEYSSLAVVGGSNIVTSSPASINILANTGAATATPNGYDGVALTLSCAFSYTPTSITWSKDNILVDTTANSGYEKSSSAPNHYLKIVSPQTSDAGSYTCVADYGTATVSGTVTTLAIKGFSVVPTYTKVGADAAFTMSCTISAGLGTSGNLEMYRAHPSFISGW